MYEKTLNIFPDRLDGWMGDIMLMLKKDKSRAVCGDRSIDRNWPYVSLSVSLFSSFFVFLLFLADCYVS